MISIKYVIPIFMLLTTTGAPAAEALHLSRLCYTLTEADMESLKSHLDAFMLGVAITKPQTLPKGISWADTPAILALRVRGWCARHPDEQLASAFSAVARGVEP